jgi:hypothetical protein
MRGRIVFALVTAVAIIVTIAGLVAEPRRALASYLVALLYWFTLAVGALLLGMVAHASRAVWFIVVRRVAERVFVTMPVFVLLFVPVVLGVKELYPWATGQAGEGEKLPEHLRTYLSTPFFVLRGLLYFAIFVMVAELLYAWSRRQETATPLVFKRRQLVVAGGGIPFVFLALTFAAVDWLMSLEPKWVSTMWGVYVFAGSFLGGLAVVTVLAWLAQRDGELTGQLQPTHFHALGRLLLTFVIFWAYIGYGQFFLIWIADLPDEVTFFHHRLVGPWLTTSVCLVLFHFVLPFLVLLVRPWKFRPELMGLAGIWILFWHYVDVYWMVQPALYPDGPGQHWLDLAAVLAVGGIVGAVSWLRTRGAPAAAVGDPELAASVRYLSS